MNESVIYSSGFVGQPVAMSEPMSQVETARYVLEKTNVPGFKKFSHSLEVEDLWGLWTKRDPIKTRFEFLDKLVQIALRHLGDGDVLSWVSAQLSSSECGHHHDTWITETLGFVLAGYSRHTNYAAWCFILTAGGNVGSASILSEKSKKLLGDKIVYGVDTMSMREFIVLWLQRPGGMADMVESLKILYGKR